jgi:hypothetical protein
MIDIAPLIKDVAEKSLSAFRAREALTLAEEARHLAECALGLARQRLSEAIESELSAERERQGASLTVVA